MLTDTLSIYNELEIKLSTLGIHVDVEHYELFREQFPLAEIEFSPAMLRVALDRYAEEIMYISESIGGDPEEFLKPN
jgi:hypothetical protein